MPTATCSLKADDRVLGLLDDFARLAFIADRSQTLLAEAYEAAVAVEKLIETESKSLGSVISVPFDRDGLVALSAEEVRDRAACVGDQEDPAAKALYADVAGVSDELETRLQVFLNEMGSLETYPLRTLMIAAAELYMVADGAADRIRFHLRGLPTGDRADA